jgi:hypothetical protein
MQNSLMKNQTILPQAVHQTNNYFYSQNTNLLSD